jgi:putative addiction module component (TIGR02574 family)
MITRTEIENLTPQEKLDLLQTVWDSIVRTPDLLPVSEAEKRALRERSETHRLNPETALSESEFKSRLEQRLRQQA